MVNMATASTTRSGSCPRCKENIDGHHATSMLYGVTYHRSCCALAAWENGPQAEMRASFKQGRNHMERRLGTFHPVKVLPPSEIFPSMICDLGLVHGKADNQLVCMSTVDTLSYWYWSSSNRSSREFTRSEGWNIQRTLHWLPDLLEMATTSFDCLWHAAQLQSQYPMERLAELGMWFEAGQYATYCCELALKTLIAIRNPDKNVRFFKRAVKHDLTEAWKWLEREQGIVLGIVRAMPLFPPTKIDGVGMRDILRDSGDFDELRWAEMDVSERQWQMVSPLMHLQLAHAAYLRARELVDLPSSHLIGAPEKKRERKSLSLVTRMTPPSLTTRPNSLNYQAHANELLKHQKALDDARRVAGTPIWMQVVKEIALSGYVWRNGGYVHTRYDERDLVKREDGLIHSTHGDAYVLNSTFQVLIAWALGERRYSEYPQLMTSLGDMRWLAHTLPMRLELITANYANLAGGEQSRLLDGRSAMMTVYGGQYLLSLQAAVFGCELTIKWLYSILNTTAPPTVFRGEIGHNALNGWHKLNKHHAGIMEVFHSMPLFQSDAPAHLQERVDYAQLIGLLQGFETAYETARYGFTDPEERGFTLPDSYRINIQLGWAVFLYGMRTAVLPATDLRARGV